MANSFKQDLEMVDESSIDGTKETDLVMIAAERLGIKTNAAKEFLRVAMANTLLMDRKQQDYGPKNISGFGTFGVLVRCNDKFERLKTLFGQGRRRKAQNESIHDSFRDISNYANIALMIELNRWPNVEP